MPGCIPASSGGRTSAHGLLTLGMMGYFLFVTLPATAGILAVWVIVEIIAWARRGAA
ncbi:MAG: hypothetical protein WDN31_17920 [Hyphomicrobium sp.]